VPPDLVKMIIRGTLSFIAKVQTTPDMTSVHDKINTINSEHTQTAKETPSVKEELKNTMEFAQRSTTIAEEAKAAAKEAAEVGSSHILSQKLSP
jgi:pantoate kinase